MTESAPPQNYESESQLAEAYQRVDFLTSDVVFDQAEQDLTRQLTEDTAVAHYAELETTQLQATRDMYDEQRNGNHEVSDQHMSRVQELAKQKDELPRNVARKYDSIRDRLDSISKPYQAMRLPADSFEGNIIKGIISEAPRPQSADIKQAPARDYEKNNQESWTYMPDEEVREYLGSRIFFDTNQVKRNAEDERILVIDADPETPLEIPLDYMVDAAGFDSWLGREGYGSGKDVSGQYQEQYDHKIPSLDVIKHYASLPSELPPVGRIDLYIQPNGVIFGDNNSGDSHRIAAAILRGDTTIKADHVSIRCLERNYLEAAPQATGVITTDASESGQTQTSQTSNGHEIASPREILSLEELNGMLESYGLGGKTSRERVENLRKLSSESLAIFMTDLNAKLNGSEESLTHDDTMKIGQKTTIEPEKRYDLFNKIVDKLKNSPDETNPARIGDALALTTILLHPFKDGNGRTARIFGFIFRDEMNGPDALEDFTTLVEPRDAARERGGYMINGYIPYMGEGTDQSDPAQIEAYIDEILSNKDKYLYTGPYGQAEQIAS